MSKSKSFKDSDKFQNRFNVKKICTITTFIHNLHDSTSKKLCMKCIICQGSINDSSPEYIEKGIDSNIVKGLCGHCFHEECINEWCNVNPICPLCTDKNFKAIGRTIERTIKLSETGGRL